MNDNDNFLDEIFHEARRWLSPESLDGSEDSQLECCSSLENLNISASDTWNCQEDAFRFACRKIKARAGEIEKRLNKVTSADILASLNVSANASGINGVNSDEFEKGSSNKKRVHFLFPDNTAAESTSGKDDKVQSLLHRIRQWLDPNTTYQPRTDVSKNNKILIAYWDAVRVVGQGRSNAEVTVYNNPFDPRLQFHGLAHHMTRPTSRESENDPGGNALLWLDKVSDVVDECLQKYTKYLKSLRQESTILREALEKTEVARASSYNASSSVLIGCGFGSYHQGSGDVSSDEVAMIEKLRSVQKLWENCTESHGSQIPRRITARKPPIAPRRRVQVMSEVKTTPSWPTRTLLGRDDVRSIQNEPTQKKPSVSPDMPPSKLDEFGDNGRKSPHLWQRIAEQHIDEESLKHLKNATKERAGVKILRPTVTTTTKDSVSKSDSWAARVAQHIYTTATAHTKTIGTVTQTASGTKTEISMSTSNIMTVVSQTKVVQNHMNSTDSALASEPSTTTNAERRGDEPTTDNGDSKTQSGDQGNDERSTAPTGASQSTVSVTASVTQTTEAQSRDPLSIAKTSSLNPLNSSPEWLRKLIARTATKTTFETTTAGVSVATTVPQDTRVPTQVPTTTSEYRPPEQRPPEESGEDVRPQTHEARCRIPPGFEKTFLETIVGTAPPPVPQQHRPVHVPAAQTWQQQPPNAIFTGMNGETFVQPGTTYQTTRVIHHQFQRPVAQVGSNIAICHPRPHYGGYMLTDVNGKAVGVGIPGWNRVDLQGRPHVLVHQPHIAATAIRTTLRPSHVFPQAPTPAATNPENFGQQAFNAHLSHQQLHAQGAKMSEAPNGGGGGYERGDHYAGFAGGIQHPQLHFQNRLIPQFVPSVQHGPPMVQAEYAVYSTQHKPQTFVKQHNLNLNNNNNDSGSGVGDNGSVADPVDVPILNESDETYWPRPRHDTRLYRTSRAIRSNLIQLA